MTTIKDDRNAAEHLSHYWLVVARDLFMSGWGGAAGGASIAAWACATLPEAEACEQWVRSRREMRNVRLVRESRYYLRRIRAAHVHVYVVDADHPSTQSLRALRALGVTQ